MRVKRSEPNKKAIYEALHLIKCYSLFQDDDKAQKIRNGMEQLNQMIALIPLHKQSFITSYFSISKSCTVFRAKFIRKMHTQRFFHSSSLLILLIEGI